MADPVWEPVGQQGSSQWEPVNQPVSTAVGDITRTPGAPSSAGLNRWTKKQIDAAPLRPIGEAVTRAAMPVLNALDLPHRGNVAMLRSPRQALLMALEPELAMTMLPNYNLANTLRGKNTYEQTQASQAAMLKQLHLPSNFWTQLATSTVTDPLTYAGGGTKLLHGLAEAHTLPFFTNRVGPMLARSTAGRVINDVAEKAHDLLGVESADKRDLAMQYGKDWVAKYGHLTGLRSAKQSAEHQTEGVIAKQFLDATKGLNNQDFTKVVQAINDGTVEQLPKELQANARKLSEITDAQKYLEADPQLKAHLDQTYTLPEWARPLQGTPAKPRGISQVRQNYVPVLGADIAVKAPKFSGTRRVSTLLQQDPSLLQRGNIPASAFEDPNAAAEFFKQSYLNRGRLTAQNLATGDILPRAAQTFPGAKPDVLFSKMIELGEPKAPQYFADLAKKAQDIEKGNIFITPLGHMWNIGTLQMLRSPTSIPKTLWEFAKTLKMSDVERMKYFAPEIYHGAVQVGSYGDRQSAFANMLGKIAGGIENRGIQVGTPQEAKILALPFRIGSGWYSVVGDALWKFDDAAKAVAFRQEKAAFLKQGLSEEEAAARAAHEVNASLVDYNTRSQLAEAMSFVYPFATWRTKAPMAAGRSIARNPGVFNFMGRLSPAAVGGQTNEPGNKATASSLPPAEMNKLLTDPMSWLVAGVNPMVRGAANPVINRLAQYTSLAPPNLATYGQPTGKYLAQNTPFLGQYLQLSGQGMFPQSPTKQLLRTTGASPFYTTSKQTGALKGRLKNFAKFYLQTHPDATDSQIRAAYSVFSRNLSGAGR